MRRDRLIYLGLLVILLAGFWPVWSCKFVAYDDWAYVARNPHVYKGLTMASMAWAFQTTELCNWHPLTWLSWMVDCELFGLNAGAHHLINLLFHILNTFLLFYVLQQYTRDRWASAMVAALFAVHPLHVESVAWVAERKDTLSTLFGLLTLWAYGRYVQPDNQSAKFKMQNYLLAILFFALGLMSKPMLTTWPFVMLLLDFWPLGRITGPLKPGIGRLLWEKVPFFFLSAVSSAVTIFAQHGTVLTERWLTPAERVSNALVSYVRYLGKILWPENLVVYYPYPYSTTWPFHYVVEAILLLVAISAATVWCIKRRPFLIFGWLWFLGTLVPVVGLVSPNSFSLADRYMYIPSIGLFVMVAWGLRDFVDRWPQQRVPVASAVVILLASSVACCNLQASYWKNTETLFRHTVAVTSPNVFSRYLLGLALVDEGKTAEGMMYLNETLRMNPSYSAARAVIGEEMQREGNIAAAVYHYREILRVRPDSPPILNNLAWILATSRDPALRNGTQAVQLAERACVLTDYRAAVYIGTLAAAYAEAGQYDKAVQAAGKAEEVARASGAIKLAEKNKKLGQLYRDRHPYDEGTANN